MVYNQGPGTHPLIRPGEFALWGVNSGCSWYPLAVPRRRYLSITTISYVFLIDKIGAVQYHQHNSSADVTRGVIRRARALNKPRT